MYFQIIKYSILLLCLQLTFAQTQLNTQLENKFLSQIKKYTLSNGLRIILMKNPTSPTIACYLKLGVGSSDEPFDQAGVAHFLEHLLFKGTEEIGTLNFLKENKYLKQIQAVGEKIDRITRQLKNPLLNSSQKNILQKKINKYKVQLKFLQSWVRKYIIPEEDSHIYSLAGQVGYNAYTSTDVTNYQIQLPKNRLELWAWLESNRFLNPILREYYTERKVILEERRLRYDTKPTSLLYELFLKTAFGMSPYGKPVIGYASNILKYKKHQTKQFFNNFYHPNNMVITIVGDIDFDESFNILKQYFEKIPKVQKYQEMPPIEYEVPRGKKTAILETQNTPYLILGWHKPSLYHKSNIHFDVLNLLLTSGKQSRLYKRLVLEEGLASYITSYVGIPGNKLNNMMAFFIQPFKESDYLKIETIINEELEKILMNGIKERELEKIKNQYYKQLLNSLESNSGLADTLSYYEVLYNDYNIFFKELKNLNLVSSKSIQQIVEQYFIEKNKVAVWIKNTKE